VPASFVDVVLVQAERMSANPSMIKTILRNMISPYGYVIASKAKQSPAAVSKFKENVSQLLGNYFS
jgi:hypothetical protein